MLLQEFINDILGELAKPEIVRNPVTFELFVYPGKDGRIWVGGSSHRITFTINAMDKE